MGVGDDVHGVMLPGAAAALPIRPIDQSRRGRDAPRGASATRSRSARRSVWRPFWRAPRNNSQPRLASSTTLAGEPDRVSMAMDSGSKRRVRRLTITVAVVAQPGHPRWHPASITTRQGLEHRLHVFVDPAGKHSERRTKPEPSSTSPRVRAHSHCASLSSARAVPCGPRPRKNVLVRSSASPCDPANNSVARTGASRWPPDAPSADTR